MLGERHMRDLRRCVTFLKLERLYKISFHLELIGFASSNMIQVFLHNKIKAPLTCAFQHFNCYLRYKMSKMVNTTS
jgi:hypothetical protein